MFGHVQGKKCVNIMWMYKGIRCAVYKNIQYVTSTISYNQLEIWPADKYTAAEKFRLKL